MHPCCQQTHWMLLLGLLAACAPVSVCSNGTTPSPGWAARSPGDAGTVWRGVLPGSLPKAESALAYIQNSLPSAIAAHTSALKPRLDPFIHTYAKWQEKKTVWSSIVAKKANCIAQVDEEPLAARKGYKNIITLTSIRQAVWANEDPGQAASWGNGLVVRHRVCTRTHKHNSRFGNFPFLFSFNVKSGFRVNKSIVWNRLFYL